VLSLKATHAERADVLGDAFDRLATRLLSNLEPEDESIGLLILVITDAALSGDRVLLAGAQEAISRLGSYVGGSMAWATEFQGRLWTLEQLVGLSDFLLSEEARIARHLG
jgi:hypothetical protein